MKLWKRLASFALVSCLLVCTAASAFAATSDRYVALGDSITWGYAPGGTSEQPAKVSNPFVDQLAGNLGIDDYTNLSDVGATSADLLTKIAASQDKLAGASLITITIGGNDLMGALYSYLTRCYNSDHPDSTMTEDEMKLAITSGDTTIFSAVADYIGEFPSSPEAGTALVQLSQNLTAAIAQLKLLAPSAQIIVANQYNPYQYLQKKVHADYDGFASRVPALKTLLDQIDTLTATFDAGIQALNSALVLGSQNGTAYAVANLYTAFSDAVANDIDPCNASFSLDSSFSPVLNPDFHPNQTGHDLIAEVLSGFASCRVNLTASAENFAPVNEGYETAGSISFTLENVGTEDLSGLAVALSDSANFVLNGPDAGIVKAGETATFTLTPKTGLAAGSYSVTVTVSAANHSSISKTFTFKVNIPTYNLSVSGGIIAVNGEPTTQTSFTAGTVITLTADEPAEGNHFKGWTISGVTVEDTGKDTITFTMPKSAVTATAQYEAHLPAEDDGDCTTPVLCTFCGAVVTPGHASHSLVLQKGQAPTHSEPGWTDYYVCDTEGCSHTEGYEVLAPDYVILDNTDNPVAEGYIFTAKAEESLTIRASGHLEKLRYITVDNIKVSSDCYDKKEGSTVLTLHADYLDTLARGDHLLTFVYEDGAVSASFRLSEKTTENTSDNSSSDTTTTTGSPTANTPQTGEGNALMLSITTALLSLSAMAALFVARRRSRQE